MNTTQIPINWKRLMLNRIKQKQTMTTNQKHIYAQLHKARATPGTIAKRTGLDLKTTTDDLQALTVKGMVSMSCFNSRRTN